MYDAGDADGSSRLHNVRELARVLRGPESGLIGQSVRYATAGIVSALVYLGITTLLATVADIPFQAALAIGYCAGVVVHFSLQRGFVWVYGAGFALELHRQVGRYCLVVAAQYGATVAATSLLPAALGLPTVIVYLIAVPIVIAVTFLALGRGVFHGRPSAPGGSPGAASQPAPWAGQPSPGRSPGSVRRR